MSEQLEQSEFGDFQEVKEEVAEQPGEEQQEGVVRARMPRDSELIGKIMQRFGGNRMEVLCTDGKTRNCRVPGRYKRRLWLRPGAIVIVVPWSDDDGKGDVIFKYPPAQINQLKKKGLLSGLNDEF